MTVYRRSNIDRKTERQNGNDTEKQKNIRSEGQIERNIKEDEKTKENERRAQETETRKRERERQGDGDTEKVWGLLYKSFGRKSSVYRPLYI